jgi:vacuolar iron transporter family protein
MKIRNSIKKGLGFGLTSGVITTLGLIVGLYSGTGSLKIIIGGILIIAIADALSDSLGIHISEESQKKQSEKQIWEATITTFFTKFFIAITFIIPVVIFPLNIAVIASITWGLFIISFFSFYIARQHGIRPYRAVLEHLILAIIVIIVTFFVGRIIGKI